MPRADRSSIRAHLSAAMRPIHEALHRDALLGRMVQPDISMPEYVAVLRVFRTFFRSLEAERCRMGCWGNLSLDAVVGALTDDLGIDQRRAAYCPFDTSMELLGGFYVAHGASFGRNVFRRNIEQALQAAPQAFLTLPGPGEAWQELSDLLETLGQNSASLEAMTRGAEKAFALVASLARAERRHLNQLP